MDNCSSDVISFAVAENISTDLVFTSVEWPVFGVVAGLASLQIIFAIACLLFNIIFRKRRIVKLTSPNLNYLIIVGVVFLSLSMVGYSYPFSSELTLTIACPLRAVFLSVVGHNLCFVVQLTKLWRIYHVFHKPSHSKKIITDEQLLLFVAVVMAPDFVIYGVFLSLEIAYSNAGLYVNREMSTQTNADQCFVFYSCGSSLYSVIRSVLTIIYKFTLHAVTFYLTIRLRKTKIPVLNDRIPVVLTVYTTSVLTILVGITVFTLQEYPNVFAGIFGVCIWIDANVFLGLTFIPKMVLLYKDPNGVNVITKKEIDTTVI